MDLSTYSGLQTAIADYMGRPGDSIITSNTVGLIQLFEAKVRRNFRHLPMSITTILPVTGQFVSLPPGFLEIRSIFITSSPSVPLRFIGQDAIQTLYDDSQLGRPQYYTIDNGQIQFAPTPSGAFSAQIAYYAFTPLSATNTSNWLLAGYPDLYLYGSLRESSAYVSDEGSAAGWDRAYNQAYAELERSDSRARLGPSASMRPSCSTP